MKIPPPTHEILGAEMVSVEPGRAVMKFHPGETHTNPFGVVQGGILVAMIDDTIGPAVYLLDPGRVSTTIELKVNFLAAARPGDELVAEAVVVHHGRTTAYTEVTLRRGDKLIARASATNLIMEKKT